MSLIGSARVAMATEIAGDIVAAGTALAGLLLVFMGVVATSFQSYDAAGKAEVRGSFKWRALLGLFGFIPSLIAACFSLAGKWLDSPCLVVVSIMFLGLSFVVAPIAAIFTVLYIK